MSADCFSYCVSQPKENLARFRWHTGAEPTPLRPGERVPVLFRDIGPEAITRLLRGSLTRLAGPVTPITYLRTASYQEPYTDYARIGRLVLLRPFEVEPWHSGVAHVFIAAASRMPSDQSYGFVPGTIPLAKAAGVLAGAKNVEDLREAFGGREYDIIRRESLSELDRLTDECRHVERAAVSLRTVFQTGSEPERSLLAVELEKHGINETDLCAAWHHLPIERRVLVKEVLPNIRVRRSPEGAGV